ncbi:MAG: hypothetical protein M5R36_01365 [Deltaproteobacteria bacterium]|nr:hypothetical protein [Deltaproteobacteria bacterium]
MDPVRTRHDDELVREVTRLGIVYNLVTEYTTFLAVPESLKTADIKDKIRQGKLGYTKKLIDGMEGIRLSQANIPPGDPVLSVAAPADAQNVTAYFPFGLVKALRYDEIRGHWSVRFLVPRDVPDGTYIIRVRIVHADGRVEVEVGRVRHRRHRAGVRGARRPVGLPRKPAAHRGRSLRGGAWGVRLPARL